LTAVAYNLLTISMLLLSRFGINDDAGLVLQPDEYIKCISVSGRLVFGNLIWKYLCNCWLRTDVSFRLGLMQIVF